MERRRVQRNENGPISLDDSLKIKYSLIIVVCVWCEVSLPPPLALPPAPPGALLTLDGKMTSSKALTPRRWHQSDLGEDGGFSRGGGGMQGAIPRLRAGGEGRELGGSQPGLQAKKGSKANFAFGPSPNTCSQAEKRE